MTSMGFLPRGWLLLALSLVFACTWASITPGVAEVDLIFPRNESYPPSPLTPVIFAIQNPGLLSSLEPRIKYSIEQQNVSTSDMVSTSGSIELSKINYTASDPYFLYWSTNKLNIEGTFLIAWELKMYNCSHDPESNDLNFEYFGSRRHQSFFSTKNGTSPPDLVAATEDDTCDQSPAQAVHVPDLLEVPSGQVWGGPTYIVAPTPTWYTPPYTWGAPSCAATVDPSPTPSPCNVKIHSSAAASISAALTSTACANPLRTGLSCPTPSSENAASMGQLPHERPWILAMGMLFAYGLV
ncbi:hypothetical protein BDV38DRAFT_277491 [Aspergillus pseudotamarii]|uniref:DUF7136 domain-containing protein n=1 Tax=Aspergillus pseudotamarii TaxID=132259 RepID=A0A5N6TAY5_ASPPS|nr:uncharacterized protein BDV38DRAFT_277491 [Aspergillus pseudotamarii]KAE8143472.1 hypothetical protein BDV38DRAFT_277491 [Aspergillus pseudotamarii]